MQAILFRLAPYLICFGLGIFGAYKVTADHYRAQIAERDLAAANAVAKAQQKVIVAVQEQQTITKKTASDYEKKISDIRNKYAAYDDRPTFGLRIEPDTSARGLPTVPKAARQSNATPSCDRLSVKLRLAAELQTQNLISLQEWIEAQEANRAAF